MKSKLALLSLLTALTIPTAQSAVELDESNRYYEVDGKPVFLLGHYAWASISPDSFIDHPSTYRKMIDDAKEHGLNYLRVSLSTNRFTNNTSPKIYGGQGETPTPFMYTNNRADLDQWNPVFWDGLDQVAAYAAENDIVLHVAMFDGVSIRSGADAYRWRNSFWNIDKQARNYYGDVDSNNNGTADESYEFYRGWAFNSSSFSGDNAQKLGYYQKRFIDKAIDVLEPYSNVFFEVGNELNGADSDWLGKVIAHMATKTDKLVTVNHKQTSQVPGNAAGYSDHFGGSYALQVKDTLPGFVGKGIPAWIDPDGPTLMRGYPDGNRKAAWLSLTGGAAAWGGFTRAYWDNNNAGNWRILDYYRNLMSFLDQTGARFWLMEPDNSVISGTSVNSALVNPGNEYLVYVYDNGSVQVNLPAGEYDFVTYDPIYGTFSSVGTMSGGSWTRINRPGFASDDWVFYALRQGAFPDDDPIDDDPIDDDPIDDDPIDDDPIDDDPIDDDPVDDDPIDQNINLALTGTAHASSDQSDSLWEANAIDGDKATRWSSEYTDYQWLYVDLGSAKTVGKVVVHWERAAAAKYKILVSNDRQNWTEVHYETNGWAGEFTHSFTPVQARYVGVLGEERGTGWGYSIWEFEIYAQ